MKYTLFSGPSLTAGKYGNAVYTPNTNGHSDGNTINLGLHNDDCFGNVSLCINGATLSLWIKTAQPTHMWPRIIAGSWFIFWLKYENSETLVSATLKNGSHELVIRYFTKLSYNQWHNIGMTYSPKDGFEVYFDGCKIALTSQVIANIPTPMSIELGCYNGGNCVEAKYDDLRFWTAKKNPHFMWWLWKM